MQPNFELHSYTAGFGALLLCPACGFNHLHHEKVDVFERTEDETSCLHVSVSDAKVTIDKDLEGNPSSRRHGMTIQFWCEECSAKPVLSILQHKGQTFIDFK